MGNLGVPQDGCKAGSSPDLRTDCRQGSDTPVPDPAAAENSERMLHFSDLSGTEDQLPKQHLTGHTLFARMLPFSS